MIDRRAFVMAGLSAVGLCVTMGHPCLAEAAFFPFQSQSRAIGDTTTVGGTDIWTGFEWGDHYTKHFDTADNRVIFCLEQNYINGNGQATLRNLVGSATRIHGHGFGNRTLMWQQAHVTDCAGIVDWVYNHAGFTSDEDRYVAAQGFIWAYIWTANLEQLGQGSVHYLPKRMYDRTDEVIRFVQTWRVTHIGHGVLYDKANNDQKLGYFSSEEITSGGYVTKSPAHIEYL